MSESGDVLELQDNRGRIHNEKLVRERSEHMHNILDSFSKGGWKLPHDLCAQLRHDPLLVDNLREGEDYGKYEFKREHQTKLVPTSECCGLEVLGNVNTSDGKCNYDDFPPEDPWPNFNAMATKLQENFVGSPGEKFVAQHHGFDRDFWAGSFNSPTTVLYRVHMKPRTAMFDPSHCATTSIPHDTRILSRKTFLKDSHARRTVEIEHDFVKDKDAWSRSVEGVKWTGVASPVEWRVMRTGKGRETGTGYTKPDAPLQWPQEVTARLQPNQSSWHWDRSKS